MRKKWKNSLIKDVGTMAYWLKREVKPPHSVIFFFFSVSELSQENQLSFSSDCMVVRFKKANT